MAAMIIAYDLNKERPYPKELLEFIKKIGGVKLSESSYAVALNEQPEALFKKIKPFLDSNDNLYIITLKQPIAGQGSKETNDWLANYVPF